MHALEVSKATALPAHQPRAEFKAVVDSINTLLGRQHAALTRERELASEIAHELRTPLASLALHARSLRGRLSDDERNASLERLEHDVLRAGHVLGQLLALARASRAELALVAPCTFPINGHAVLLEMALRNLIENALGHTPQGTTVEVQLDAQARWLQVCDDGLRVAAAGRVADAAGTTALGLGLGHRVVEKIAGLHGAGFAAVPAPVGFDTCYRVDFGADVES